MKTIIFDIDGTITDMWPIEKSVLISMLGKEADVYLEKMKASGILNSYAMYRNYVQNVYGINIYYKKYTENFILLEREKTLPMPKAYPIVDWIKNYKYNYNFIYATGGQLRETQYVLNSLGIGSYFDLKNSISKTTCRYSKRTGIPFTKINKIFSDCLVITDSQQDCEGAKIAGIPYIKIRPGQKIENFTP